jgi:acyl transferase domain-containing protein
MSPRASEPIAIVGSACRFAGDASSPSKLWDVLQNPKDLLQKIPASRFNADAFYHPDGSYHGHSNVKHAYLLNEDMAAFDAEFFGIKAAEAKAMDPQQRLLMETTYEALEAAGMPITNLKESDTGVYVGVMFNDYACMLLRDFQDIPTYYATGTGQSILSNRISYFFNWHGPSVTIDTACSSSLVAVHMAVQALRAGDSRMAVACGSNLILDPMNFVIESKLKMLSPDGRSRMWDQEANGYARGEGVATLVLKTLSAALEDGDHIECIIRETALNQDGQSAGITMPSPSAQEALIRSTYAKAGLDLLSAKDRPQYFEAHGTGTPAGDPTEAEAVYNAFWDADARNKGLELNGGNPLYVGSIKTVLGHTEGTAGVAAILKASLSLQNGTIPPNLLFEKLSDRVAPFYKNVEILKAPRAWPMVAGAPKRASVNSFGFGGANAHAILEGYEGGSNTNALPSAEDVGIFTPFVFSAFSEQSLRANLSEFKEFLLSHPETNIKDLAWTLRERRSLFSHRLSFAASSLVDLEEQIAAKLEDENTSLGIKPVSVTRKGTSKILGIFTGQGAQYARMGAELIEKSETARSIIERLETDLANLPDGPAWSLKAEILEASSTSRINEAILSQPLCTALQIMLVDLLRLANVHFEAVIGHSSGEIAAAYAAGLLTARDAICVAYYRGLHVQNSASPNGADIKGAMIAVGSSLEDITDLCEDEAFSGRLSVAASNSSSSVTVSGDEDAIAELQVILDDEKKFNRLLKVDKAYHSNHMLPCYAPYVASLRRCGVKVQTPSTTCTWFSSVYNRAVDFSMELADTYWAENMTKPVLFTEALGTALAASTYDLVLEVGAHPALKGPATQTIQEILERAIPYSGVLARGINAVEASATGLGFLWSHFDKSNISLDAYERAMTGDDRQFSVIKGLPTYQWNHQNKYWHESRTSRKMRMRPQPVHSLLGDVTTDSAPHHMSWKNLLRESQLEWVSGHKVQSQTVFPAAGYLTTALEASRFVAEAAGKEIRLIDVKDFVIHQALVFSQDDAGIEIVTSMADIAKDEEDRICARFTYSAAMNAQAEDLTLVASAEIEIQLGEVSTDLLPKRKPALSHVIDVEPERFYSALAELGYEFSGPFRSLSGLQRKHYQSTCLMKVRPAEAGADALFIHPAELDAALQSIILAYSYPYDEQLRSLHLPTSIQHIRINPALLGADRSHDEFFPVDSAISPKKPGQRGIFGHVEVYSEKSPHAAIQIQGASFMPLGGGATEEDRRVFSRVHWVNSHPDGLEAGRDIPLTEDHRDTVRLLERIATFYLRKFDKEIPADHPMRSEFTTKWYLNYARYITDMVETGQHKWAQKEWLQDTVDDIMEASKPFMHLPDVQIMHITGQQMPRVFNGETTILEQFRATDILDRYYANGFGLRESGQWVSKTVKQLVDRYPHMNILEIGEFKT